MDFRSWAGPLKPAGLDQLRLVRAFAQKYGAAKVTPFRAYRAIVSSRLNIVPRSVDLTCGPIVDIGANVGDWTAGVLTVLPRAAVIAVEPSPPLLQKLRTRFGSDARVQIVGCAVCDFVGSARFHLTEHSHNSSLFQPRQMDWAYGGGWQEVGTIEVETTTLDELVQDSAPALIKIDVQGAERAVLMGGAQTLRKAQAILIEITTRSHYEGDASFPELDAQLKSQGYRLAGLSAPFMGTSDEMLWFDACYINERARPAT